MIESYTIKVQWGIRKESIVECTGHIVQFLTCLAQCNPIFTHWFKLGESRKEALQHEVLLDNTTIQALLLEGRNRTDFGANVIEELGFHTSLWTGGSRDGEGASLSINCGSYSPAIGANSCILKLPYEGAVAEQILSVPVLEAIMGCMVTSWSPDWGVVTSNKFRKIASSQQTNAPWMGWLIYLSNSRGSIPSLPLPAKVTPFGTKGSLITVSEERFTADNPLHIEAVNRVRDALNQKELLKSHS